MNRSFFLLGVIAAILIVTSSAFAAGFPATPVGVDVVKLPLMGGKLSHQTQAILGLQPQILPVDARVFNHQRKTGEWKLEWLKAGTEVLVDERGFIRYKADCGNRIQVDGRDLRYIGNRSWKDVWPEPEMVKATMKPEPRLRLIPRIIQGMGEFIGDLLRFLIWQTPDSNQVGDPHPPPSN